MKALGIDPATHTGFVVVESTNKTKPTILCAVGVKPTPTRTPKAWGEIAGAMVRVLEAHKPDIVVIEGYGYGSQQLAAMVEVGSILRYFLWQLGYPEPIVVAPTSLKKFVTGKGNASKDIVVKDVYKQWGFDFDNTDLADAAGLACAGLHTKGMLPPR